MTSTNIDIKIRFSLNTLEYPVIIKKLAGATQSGLGRELAEKLLPSWDKYEVETRLHYTDDARAFFDRESSIPSFQALQNIHECMAKSAKGGVLSPTELWRVNTSIKSMRSCRRVIREAQFEYPYISREAQQIGLFPEIEDALDHAIHPEGDVLDRASSELQRIRGELARERDKVERTLAGMINEFSRKGYLRDGNYTVKNGRYVLPFRQDCQKNVKAIVQARSSAGSTVFMEPYELVERNNRMSELKGEEEGEVQQILIALSGLVGSRADEVRASLNTASFLDFVFACGRLSREWKGVRAMVGESVDIRKARHPMIPYDEVVPVDISYPGKARALIISGPNAGGKTVALKTMGLFALINQAGLHVPCRDGTTLPIFGCIHADIGDQQSIEWNLSSFSAHVELVKRMLQSLRQREHLPGLVLLDEIGRSTDPQEGSALSLAIIEKLLGIDCFVAVTTHLPAIKNLVLSEDERVAGASVEFDIQNAQPLYTIRTGSLGASYAIAIARRLGLDADILERADELLAEKSDLLAVDMPGLEQHLEQLEAEVARAKDAKEHAQKELAQFTVMERLIVLAALQEADKIATEAEKKLAVALKIAGKMPHKLEKEEISAELKVIREYSDKLRKAADLLSAPVFGGAVKPGEKAELEEGKPVWVVPLRREAEFVSSNGKRVTVIISGKKLKVPIDQIRPLSEDESSDSKAPRAKTPPHRSLPLFIDIHGLTVEEAITKLDPYLDEAYYQGRERAHVIHGFGTGRLRKGVHEYLKKHQFVEKFEFAEFNQGGAGVTVVTLKKEK